MTTQTRDGEDVLASLKLYASGDATALRHYLVRDMARDALAEIASLRSENERLREALEELLHAVCSETGFAAAVRYTTGVEYPWPALDIAEEKARAALSTEASNG